MSSRTHNREHLIRSCMLKQKQPDIQAVKKRPPKTNKTLQDNLNLVWSKAQVQGKRDHQEDRLFITELDQNKILFVITDGHRGTRCVNFVIGFFPQEVQKQYAKISKKKQTNLCSILKSAVKSTHDAWAMEVLGNKNQRFPKNQAEQQKIIANLPKDFFTNEGDSGTTLISVLIDKQNKMAYVVSLGDSRAVILQDELIISTRDHSVPKKLEYLKGTEFEKTIRVLDSRLCSDLAMIASIGDYTPDLLGVLRTIPDVCCIPISLSPSCIVLASDGLWDVVDPQELFLNPFKDAQSLVTQFQKRFYDNTTIIVIFLS
jgi:serine/threonine protein phosphatase PrpC